MHVHVLTSYLFIFTAHADDDEDEAAKPIKKKKKKTKKVVAAKPREEVVKNVDLSTAILGGSSARNSMQVRILMLYFSEVASSPPCEAIMGLKFDWTSIGRCRLILAVKLTTFYHSPSVSIGFHLRFRRRPHCRGHDGDSHGRYGTL